MAAIMSFLQGFSLLVATVLWHQKCAALFFAEPKGELTVNFEMNYVGDNLTAECRKYSAINGSVFFERGNVRYDAKFITQINSTLAVLNRPVTSDDFGKTIMGCSDNSGLISHKNIYNDYPLQSATDRQLVWLDEKFLLIHWGFNNTTYHNAHNEQVFKVTAEWRNSTNLESWLVCYDGMLKNAFCNVTAVLSELAAIDVRVNISSVKRGRTLSTVFPGQQAIREYAKPYPVSELSVTVYNSTTVQVNTHSYDLRSYNITYYTQGNEEDSLTKNTSKSSDQTFNVSGLHPAYTYIFEVSAKYDVNRGYLSDIKKSDPITMWEDAPSAGPVVTPAAFHLDCSGNKTSTTAYIYFQAVPGDAQNGVIIKNTATVEREGAVTQTFTQTNSSGSEGPHTVKLPSVTCQAPFHVTMHAYTAVGRSPGVKFCVPLWNKENTGQVEKLNLRIRYDSDKNNITAEWDPSAMQAGVNYLLYYCDKNNEDTLMCQKAARHINLPRGKQSQLLPDAHALMNFGVAAIFEDSSTNGIEFTDCVYDPTKGANLCVESEA